jgi:hypothetical protein
MATFRYVVVDVPLAGNQLAVFTDSSRPQDKATSSRLNLILDGLERTAYR